MLVLAMPCIIVACTCVYIGQPSTSYQLHMHCVMHDNRVYRTHRIILAFFMLLFLWCVLSPLSYWIATFSILSGLCAGGGGGVSTFSLCMMRAWLAGGAAVGIPWRAAKIRSGLWLKSSY